MRAMMMLILAITAGSPIAVRAGKLINDPPPAMAFTCSDTMAARPIDRYPVVFSMEITLAGQRSGSWGRASVHPLRDALQLGHLVHCRPCSRRARAMYRMTDFSPPSKETELGQLDQLPEKRVQALLGQAGGRRP